MNANKFLYFTLRLILLGALASPLNPQIGSASTAPFRVVIDPGHGGLDEGTVFDAGTYRIAEKDVTLALARQVARQLRTRGYNVVMTRNQDRELPLPARTALANRLQADVFLSIHMNSAAGAHPSRTEHAEGIETFILNNATDASSKRLARLENSVITGGHQPDSPEQMDVALILKDLRLDANLSESKRLACSIQSSLVSATSPSRTHQARNRGVKQALFHVLLGADMPSVLVEAGFLTSARDRALVLSPRGQRLISRAIANAIEQYQSQKDSPKALSTLSRCKVN